MCAFRVSQKYWCNVLIIKFKSHMQNEKLNYKLQKVGFLKLAN